MTTEGKWSVVEIDNKKNRYAVDDDGYPVATVVGEANANLIASVPELLTACKYALGVLLSIPEAYAEQIADILDESIDTGMIEDAIAKAEGEETKWKELHPLYNPEVH